MRRDDRFILLRNNGYLKGRNAANSADVNLLKVNASDIIEFASLPQFSGSPFATQAYVASVGANTALSNLASVAFNVDIVPGADNARAIASSSNRLNNLYTRTATFGPSGQQLFISGNSITKPSGGLQSASIWKEYNGNGSGSNMYMFTDSASGASNNTGSLAFETGNSTSSGNTGSQDFKTGNATSGNSGGFSFTTGTASGTRGKIKLIDGTEGTIGHVWTQSAVDGTGGWAAVAAGANTALSNLTATAINQTLLPGTDGAVGLGDSSKRWGEISTSSGISLGHMTNQGVRLSSGAPNNPLGLGGSALYCATTAFGGTGHRLSVFTIDSASATISSGALYLSSGNTTNGTIAGASGSVFITTGNNSSSNAAAHSGDINLTVGTVNGGTRGSIVMSARQLDVTNISQGVGLPVWKKYTVTHTALQAAALTNDIELLSLPAKGVIHGVVISHTTAFAGTGITTYTVSVGISGNLTKYAAAFDVFQATGDSVGQTTNVMDFENKTSATSIRIAATSTGANLNQSTTGSVDIWVLWSILT